MKKISYLILPILTASLSLTGCAKFFNNLVSPNVPLPSTLDPVSLNYTYSDLADHALYRIDYTPSVGNVKNLVIPVYFADSNKYIPENYKGNVLSDIETIFNGTSSEVGYESVASYYDEMSGGKLNLETTVSDWYHVDKNGLYYGTEVSLTVELGLAAVDWYFKTNPSENRKSYDSDGNGILDSVIFIYAHPNYSTLNLDYDVGGNLWAYVGWVQNNVVNDVNSPNLNQYMWASYDFMYSQGNDARNRAGTTYGGGDTRNCVLDAHTYIHEFGHLLGLEDYYDYGFESFKPAGIFSMQDHNIGSHDPYSALALGWAEVIVPSSTCTVELKPFQESKQVILLTNNYSGSVFDEYLLLELYTPTGLNAFDTKYKYMNKYPTGPVLPGIRLWHVDARLGGFQYTDGKLYFVGYSNAPTGTLGNKRNVVYVHATSNSYVPNYGSILYEVEGEKILNMNIIQLIRDNVNSTYKPNDFLTFDNMFTAGESFTMQKYQKQFVNKTAMNSGNKMLWSFEVNSASNQSANITLTLNSSK